jgi:hypothetical protein
VSKVVISERNITLVEGQTRRLTARLEPDGADEPITWSSSMGAIASVDQDGNVVALASGSIYVYASAGQRSDGCLVNVLRSVDNVTIEPIEDQTYVGYEVYPNVVVRDKGQELDWYAYDVEYKNNVGPGTATVTITGKEDYGYTGSKSVTFNIVKANSPADPGGGTTPGGTTPGGTNPGGTNPSDTTSGGSGPSVVERPATPTHTTTPPAETVSRTKANNPMRLKAVKRKIKASKLKKKARTVAQPLKFTKKAVGRVTYARVAKGSSKRLTVNAKTGKVTIKKGTKKGTYKIKIRVTADGNDSYKRAVKTVTCTVVVA